MRLNMNSESVKNVIEAVDNDDCWDNGELGRDEQFAREANKTSVQQVALDEALDLQMISIRLPKAMIEDFKFIAEVNGLKYQTLMRQVLAHFADMEKKNMQKKAANRQIALRKIG
jgi:predicted DNA binding CopG/RHH family protein